MVTLIGWTCSQQLINIDKHIYRIYKWEGDIQETWSIRIFNYCFLTVLILICKQSRFCDTISAYFHLSINLSVFMNDACKTCKLFALFYNPKINLRMQKNALLLLLLLHSFTHPTFLPYFQLETFLMEILIKKLKKYFQENLTSHAQRTSGKEKRMCLNWYLALGWQYEREGKRWIRRYIKKETWTWEREQVKREREKRGK